MWVWVSDSMTDVMKLNSALHEAKQRRVGDSEKRAGKDQQLISIDISILIYLWAVPT